MARECVTHHRCECTEQRLAALEDALGRFQPYVEELAAGNHDVDCLRELRGSCQCECVCAQRVLDEARQALAAGVTDA